MPGESKHQTGDRKTGDRKNRRISRLILPVLTAMLSPVHKMHGECFSVHVETSRHGVWDGKHLYQQTRYSKVRRFCEFASSVVPAAGDENFGHSHVQCRRLLQYYERYININMTRDVVIVYRKFMAMDARGRPICVCNILLRMQLSMWQAL